MAQSGTKSYQDRVSQVAKYAGKMGWALSSPKVHKYAITMGVNPEDLEAEAGDVQADADAGVRKYAERMGLPVNSPQVRKYATAGTEEDVQTIDIEGSADVGFKEAVLHYAQKMNLGLDDRQVQKYARGLLKPSGDFSEDSKPVETQEAIERRFNEAIQRYAERVGLSVDSEQVIKYANGLRRASVLPTAAKPPQVRRPTVEVEEHVHQ